MIRIPCTSMNLCGGGPLPAPFVRNNHGNMFRLGLGNPVRLKDTWFLFFSFLSLKPLSIYLLLATMKACLSKNVLIHRSLNGGGNSPEQVHHGNGSSLFLSFFFSVGSLIEMSICKSSWHRITCNWLEGRYLLLLSKRQRDLTNIYHDTEDGKAF